VRATRLAGLVAALVLVFGSAPAHADMLDDWHAATIDAVADPGTGWPAASGFSRLAIVQLAVYDAVMAIERGHEPYYSHPHASRHASVDAAIATAAHDSLVAYLPAAVAAGVETRYATSLAGIPDGPAKAKGIAVGRQTAADLVALRAGDGFFVDKPEYYVPLPPGPGVWQPNPAGPGGARGLYPWLAYLQPFTLEAPDQFMSGPPPSLTSDDFARAYNEVKDYGRADSTVRSAEQTNLALFFTESPPRQYGRLARELGARFHVSLADRARLYAEIHVAAADAGTGCWASKYHYQFWRPQAAITTTFDDGNSATTTDPTWTPLRPTPNYADWPSGHACVTAATMATLRSFFGTDDIPFTLQHLGTAENPSTGLIDNTLEFERFSDVARAVQSARTFLGIHFRFAQVAGDRLGRKTVRWMLDHYFQPTGSHPCRDHRPWPR
jgi:hypothetical protein